MSSIEEKALALASKWERRFVTPCGFRRRQALVEIFTMLVTEQEAHEADKQAFSDAVEAHLATWDYQWRTGDIGKRVFEDKFDRFIIKKPDPLDEVLERLPPNFGRCVDGADAFRQALAARGLGVARIGEVVEGQQQ